MKSLTIAGTMLLLVVGAVSTSAQELSIHLEAVGRLDALFQGVEILASIAADVGLVGDAPVRFTATGRAYGIGVRNILSLISEGWILLAASGQTADEEPILFRSLVYVSRQTFMPLRAGDLVEGLHHTVIQIGRFVDIYWGALEGSLVGGLAPADVAGTIRLAGEGDFYLQGQQVLAGSPGGFPEAIPLDDPDVPDEFLEAVAKLFDSRETLPSEGSQEFP